MASEHIKYKCWCGSEDFETDSDGVSTCIRCGSRFVIEDGCTKFKIRPETDERQFLRAAWIRLAREDAPLDVFDCDFKAVGEIEYQAMIDSISAKIPYQVSIGYDRHESYTATETRPEYEQYVDKETVYDQNLKQYVQLDTTKWRWVDKQYTVVKHRTVTDWKPFSSEFSAKSSVLLRNGDEISYVFDGMSSGGDFEYGLDFSEDKPDVSLVYFDPDAIMENLEKAREHSVVAPNAGERGQMTVDSSASREASDKHLEALEKSLITNIPGDHCKDLSYSVQVTESSTRLLMVPEYYATINYGGKDYTIKSLPFGSLPMCGGEIENRDGLRVYEAKKRDELGVAKKGIEEVHAKEKWDRSKSLLILATVLLVAAVVGLTVVGSVAYGYYVSDPKSGYPIFLLALLIVFIVLFAAAVTVYIVSAVLTRRSEKEVESAERAEIMSREEETSLDIAAFTKNYKVRQLKLLNKKLRLLGLDSATIKDISDSRG